MTSKDEADKGCERVSKVADNPGGFAMLFWIHDSARLSETPPRKGEFSCLYRAKEVDARLQNETGCSQPDHYRAALQRIINEGDYTAPEGMKRIARDALDGVPNSYARELEMLQAIRPWLVWGPDSPGPQWKLNEAVKLLDDWMRRAGKETGPCQHDVSKPGCTVTPNGLCAFKCAECQQSWDVDGLERRLTPSEEASFNKTLARSPRRVGPKAGECKHGNVGPCDGCKQEYEDDRTL